MEGFRGNDKGSSDDEEEVEKDEVRVRWRGDECTAFALMMMVG